jgi:ATP-dependent RNA helicase SUPV3L1/SUV3
VSAEGAATPAAEARPQEPRQEVRGNEQRDRPEGKGRDRDRDNKREKFGDRQGSRRDERDRGRDRDKGRDKRDREGGPALRHYASSSNPRERDRAADPNSPFAKLAALKEQLAGRKE